MTYFPPPSPGEPMPPVPGYTPGGMAPPPRSNGPAIASLVLGILGCIPYITGLLAILFGIIGLRRSGDPYASGKGMAVAGLVLGIVSVVLWSTCLGFGAWAYVQSGPARSVARQYIQDLSTDNLAAAQANAARGVSSAQLEAQRDQMKGFGALQDVRFTGMYYQNVNGTGRWRLTGIGSFASGGSRMLEAVLVEENGLWKVQSLQVR